MAIEEADLIVIGSGQGGVPLAVDFARAGKRVVLFERGELGGTCVNYGCTPSNSCTPTLRSRANAPCAAAAARFARQRCSSIPALAPRFRRSPELRTCR